MKIEKGVELEVHQYMRLRFDLEEEDMDGLLSMLFIPDVEQFPHWHVSISKKQALKLQKFLNKVLK